MQYSLDSVNIASWSELSREESFPHNNTEKFRGVDLQISIPATIKCFRADRIPTLRLIIIMIIIVAAHLIVVPENIPHKVILSAAPTRQASRPTSQPASRFPSPTDPASS